jgi:hypothetical protein
MKTLLYGFVMVFCSIDEDFQPSSNISVKIDVEVGNPESMSTTNRALRSLLEYRRAWLGCCRILHRWVHFCMKQTENPRNSSNDRMLLGIRDECKASFESLMSSVLDLEKCIAEGLLEGGFIGPNFSPEIGFAYNDLLVKRLQLNPPRKLTVRSFSDSLTAMKSMCKDVAAVVETVRMLMEQQGLHFEELLCVCMDLSQHRLHLLARSLVVAAIRYYTADTIPLVIQSLSLRNFPKSLLTYPLLLEKWMPTLARVCWDSLRAMLAHRAKLQTRLEVVLAEWATVVNDAPFVDHHYHAEVVTSSGRSGKSNQKGEVLPWFRYWTLALVTQLMDLYMGLLMENQLIAISELDYFYWYKKFSTYVV